MAAKVKLDAIVEAIELASESNASFLDRETGEVHMLTQEELDLAESGETVLERQPEWLREAVELARKIQGQEGKRYLALPSSFDVHEWDIMDRFSDTIDDAQVQDELHSAIRGAGAFRRFKDLLSEYQMWDAWNRFKQAELRQIAIEWCEEHGLAYREK